MLHVRGESRCSGIVSRGWGVKRACLSVSEALGGGPRESQERNTTSGVGLNRANIDRPPQRSSQAMKHSVSIRQKSGGVGGGWLTTRDVGQQRSSSMAVDALSGCRLRRWSVSITAVVDPVGVCGFRCQTRSSWSLTPAELATKVAIYGGWGIFG